jgi:protocatechuate 3,4-dioxygenase beta subunit
MSNKTEPAAEHALPAVSRRGALGGLGAGLLAGFGGVTDVSAQSAADAWPIQRSGAWATGGTAAMHGITGYPDPFARADSSCTLTCQQILGPCWAPKAPVRQDISEAEPGIPMRMALRLVQADGCTPIEGAEVEVWHSNIDGVYSAEDAEGGAFCTSGNEHALAGYFMRGRAVSDLAGKLVFDACYPGWYGGRAVHIHLLVRPPGDAGDAHTRNAVSVTQLYFPDELSEEIFAEVAGYRDLGQPETTNATDGVIRSAGGDVTPYLFGVDQLDDGAMLAWKTLAISTEQSCGSRQMGGFGGRGRFRRRAPGRSG